MSHPSQSIAQALAASSTLQALQANSRLGQQRLALLRQLLDPALTQHLQSGTSDDAQWCILCPNTATAAKLRQWLPLIQQHIQACEQRLVTLRVKLVRAT